MLLNKLRLRHRWGGKPGAAQDPPATIPVASEPATQAESTDNLMGTQTLQDLIVQVLQTVHDPEIPVNIYELGLIYDVAIDEDGKVAIKMTLTAPGCPAAQSLPAEVETKVRQIPGVSDCQVVIVWEPTWTPARMGEAAKLTLGFM